MRRAEIVQAVQNVAEALASSHVMSALARMDTTELVSAHADWVARRQSFGGPEDRVIGVLGLEQLDEPSFWAKALSEGANRDPEMLRPISEMHRNARFAQDELPKLLGALLVRESDAVITGEGMELPGRLTVLVLEDADVSTPERLALVLESIGTLYRACAQVLAEPDTRVSVAACDSGGDKSFDFLGNVRVVDSVKEVLLSFWDRVVFYRDDKSEDRLKAIAESLPIIERIEETRKSGGMNGKVADDAKRQVAESVFMFARAGATIPEIQEFAVYDPRELMKPTAGMLVVDEGQASESAKKAPKEKAEAKKADEQAPAAVDEPAPAAVEEPAPTAEKESPAEVSTEEEASEAEQDAGISGTDLQKIIAEKVDKVLHGQAESEEADKSSEKDSPEDK